MKEIKDFKFCKDLKCKEIECARHNCNIPYNVIVTRTVFRKKDNKCEGYTSIFQKGSETNGEDNV